jgi:murein DD-endopeptidase MepM/ murein hydrolase activator NlpD
MRRWLSIAVFLIFQVAQLSAAPGETTKGSPVPEGWTLRYQPARIVNGSPVIFRVSTVKHLEKLEGEWLGRKFAFSFDAHTKTWFALAGASLETKAGSYPIQLHGETTAGQPVSFEKEVSVARQRYPRVLLKVPGKYTAPSPEEQREIEQDKKTKEEVFKTVSPEREWQGSFAAPVKTEISDLFGVQRVFNGSVQSTHQGLDFRAPTGTPVAAVNRGQVLFAGPLFMEGNFVVIDHGQGLLSLYLHLSKFSVKAGDVVEKGQQIGLSGGTGRATGPHLHLAVRWQGVYLNPQTLLALRLPGD